MPRASLVNLLYPPACLLCHHRLNGSQVFCEACEGAMPVTPLPVCQRCGVGLSGAFDAVVSCSRCRKHPLAFEQARGPLVYRQGAREAVHAFKYYGHRRVGRWLAERMAQTAGRELPLSTIDLIVPVPMHWLKRRIKGLNPAASLAHTVAQLLRVPCESGALRRTRWTPSQTRLTYPKRFGNVRGAFVAKRRLVSERIFLLIDDVLTSGATAHACALALKEAGASAVFVLTAATAPEPH